MGRPLAGWEPAELLAGGLPVFPRLLITSPRDDLVLRSFLGQPLIVYLHHEDLVDGLGALVETAAFINREPGVRWGSAESLARSSYRRCARAGSCTFGPLHAASSFLEATTSRTASG
jgi:hypothetical protein